jgi:predicted CXXCH cytochrome family protein
MIRILALLALVTAIATVAFPQSIVGSRHDLSTTGGIANRSTNESQVCVFCHTPHQGSTSTRPLWNKTLSAVTTYGTYSSTTLNATPTDIGGSTGISNLCMSCHDGTVAVNNLSNPSTTGTPTMGTGTELNAQFQIASTRAANMGSSLVNDHPINFTYNAALVTADGDLATPNSTSYVDAAHNIPLYGGQMQCGSCHNPHNNANGAFLRVSNAGSAMCRTCHTK